ncbi:serine-rich adhesin for platelets [Halyomorpha halys]|uniref:serine-rich adhesin for platelets n=1 Tax=Halyomorpha halys TaxID=286706 RepID=UPI0006D4ECEC|nr:uncharacterized threonine-rich GPI-anchored glycoprotein PJ4664.02-like [Halyomorpha halys]
MEKAVKMDKMFKTLFSYIHGHFSDTRQASNLKCIQIEENKETFVFYEIKGKIFPKKKPSYVAVTRPAVVHNKYFEISAGKKMINLKFNASQNFPHKLKEGNRTAIELQDGKAEPTKTSQLEEAISLLTKSLFLKNDTLKEITSAGVTKTSQPPNINATLSAYTRLELNNDISQSLQFTFENEYDLDNDTINNKVNNFTTPYDPERLSITSSQATMTSHSGYDSISNNRSTRIYKYVTESENEQNLPENKISHWDPTSTVSSHTASSNVQNGSDNNMSTYRLTTEANKLNLTIYSYHAFFPHKSLNATDKDSNSPIEGIKPSPYFSNASENQNHSLFENNSTSPRIPDQLTTSQVATNPKKIIDLLHNTPSVTTFDSGAEKDELNSNTPIYLNQNNLTTRRNLQDYSRPSSIIGLSFSPSMVVNGSFYHSVSGDYKINVSTKAFDNSDTPLVTEGNKWNYSKDQSKSFALVTSSLLLNRTDGFINNLNNSNETKENTVPSIKYISVSDFKSELDKDSSSSIPVYDIGTTISVIGEGISVLNYNTMTAEIGPSRESTFVPSTLSNILHQTSTEFEVLSTPHNDLQKSTQSNKIESNPIYNQKTEPTTNAYYTSSSFDETRRFNYLTSERNTVTTSDHMNPSTTEYNLVPSSSPIDSYPSLNNSNHETFYQDLSTSSSLRNNTTPTPLIFDTSDHSKGLFNHSKLEISNSSLELENRSSPSHRINNSYSTGNTGFTMKSYYAEESTNIHKHSNKSSKKETSYTIGLSSVSLLYSVHNSKDYQAVDLQSNCSESETTQNVPESNESTLPVSSDYTNSIDKTGGFLTGKNFVTNSLEKLTSELLVDRSTVPLPTALDLLTDKPSENTKLHYSDGIEVSTTSSNEKISENVYKSTSIIGGSVENNSFNYLQPLTSNVGTFGFTDSTVENSVPSKPFIQKVNDNHTVINQKKNVTSAYASVHDTNSTFYSHITNRIEELTTGTYETNTEKVHNTTSIITGSAENNSFNYFLQNLTPSVGHFGFTDSIGENSIPSKAFSQKINDNHAVINQKENVTSGDPSVHNTYSKFYSHNTNRIEESTTSTYEKTTNNLYNSTSIIKGSVENNSFSYLQHLTSSVGHLGFTDTTEENSVPSGAFSQQINDNNKGINLKENITSGDPFVHDTYSTFHSHNPNGVEETTKSAYEKGTKHVYKTTQIVTVSGENNSFNYFLHPLTSIAGNFGFTDSTGENSVPPGTFSHNINDNNTDTNRENVTSDDTLAHDINATFYSHLNNSSVTFPITSYFDNSNITKGVTTSSGIFYHSDFPNQPLFDDMIKNKTEKNEHYDYGNSLIENSTTSITEKVENVIDPLSNAETPTSNNPTILVNNTTYQQSSISSVISSLENVHPTTPLSVSSKDDVVIVKTTNEPDTMYPATGNMSSYAPVTGKNEASKISVTFNDTDISADYYKTTFPSGKQNESFSYSNYWTTIFGSTVNREETQTLTPEWNSSSLTTDKPNNLTIQGRSSEVATTEIKNYRSSENSLNNETTTQHYAQPNISSHVDVSVFIQDDSHSNFTTPISVDNTKKDNFTYTEKYEAIVNVTNSAIIEKSEDTFKPTPNSITPIIMSSTHTVKNNITLMKKSTTRHEITSTEKNSENSRTSEIINDFEMSTQPYQTMPSFNNFTFLLPTTDYLTSYLPVRIHPLIAFSEIK